eukprot:1112267-Pleurochrysis_carterae.AAC.1
MPDPHTLEPLSIGSKVAESTLREKVGAVEALEYVAVLSDPKADRYAFPCPWVALFKSCRKGDSCKHCSQVGAANAKPFPKDAVARVRGASSARLQGFIDA